MATAASSISDEEKEKVKKLAHDLPPDDDEEIDNRSMTDQPSLTCGGDENGAKSSSNNQSIRKTADIRNEERGVDFENFLLKESVLKGLKRVGYVRPSPIQLKAIPIGRMGLDLIVQAKSGLGKTCVFAVLALEIVEPSNPAPQVLIIAPTHEIALQIYETLTGIGYFLLEKKGNVFANVEAKKDGIKIECFIGGTTLQTDKDKQKQKCQIVVGTPGRIWQLVNEGNLSLDSVRLFVLDEADKLMQNSYTNDVNTIYAHLPSGKQMVVTSATYPSELDQFLSRYMKTPKFVQLDPSDVQLLGVKQYIVTSDLERHDESGNPICAEFESWFDKKVDYVHRILSRIFFNQCFIFCNFQDKVEQVSRILLTRHKWPSAYISSALNQNQRSAVLQKLKNTQIRVLVSTDIMARGIDAENVNLVIHFDLPWDAETYFHRIGRAGRFGGYGASMAIALNRKDERTFYTMAVENSFQMKKLPNIDEMPTNLVENEKFFQDLPKLDLPDLETLRKQTEKREKFSKQKQQRRDVSTRTPITTVETVDEYTKLIQLAGPVERWSPTEFVWDEKSNELRRVDGVGGGNGKRRSYSRSEMLGILKENLSSLPSSRSSIITTLSAGKDRSPEVIDQPVKGQRIDVNALFSFFEKPKSEENTSMADLANEVYEIDRRYGEDSTFDEKSIDLEKTLTVEQESAENSESEIKKYNRDELLAVRPFCTRAYAEEVFDIRNLLYTFEKKKKKKKDEDRVAAEENGKEERETAIEEPKIEKSESAQPIVDKEESAIEEAKIEKSESPRPILDKVEAVAGEEKEERSTRGKDEGDSIREKEEAGSTREKVKTVSILPRGKDGRKEPTTSRGKKDVTPAKVVDITKDYDEAVSLAVQSPFYRFFGDCTLKLQAAAVRARTVVEKEKVDKETQTDEPIEEEEKEEEEEEESFIDDYRSVLKEYRRVLKDYRKVLAMKKNMFSVNQ